MGRENIGADIRCDSYFEKWREQEVRVGERRRGSCLML